jgi:hypothetical protein
MASLTVIWWRDIPAQVNAQLGRERHQVLLPDRFQRAIDRARRKARIDTAQDDVAQWRRDSRACGSDLASEAAAEVARLVEAFPADRLGRIAYVGGVERDDLDADTVADAAAETARDDAEDEAAAVATPGNEPT